MSAVENLTRGRAETQLHYDRETGHVYLDTAALRNSRPGPDAVDGLVIGWGSNRREAIREAIDELNARVADLWMALAPPHESARPCGCDPGANHKCAEHDDEATR